MNPFGKDIEEEGKKVPKEPIRREIDELFLEVRRYAASGEFRKLLVFVARFKEYAPYNAMLIYLQKPGARFLLTAKDWREKYQRIVKNDVTPVLILIPNGPLRCLYDVGDTLPAPWATGNLFPEELDKPYDGDPGKAVSKTEFATLVEQLKWLGIHYGTMRSGESFSGKLQIGDAGDPQIRLPRGEGEFLEWRPAYSIRVCEGASDTVKFCTIVHELGHLFCRHLESGYERPWREGVRTLPHEAMEFEAETVSWLVTRRMGIDNPSYRYLAQYIGRNGAIPPEASVEAIILAANRVEKIMHDGKAALDFFRKYNPGFNSAWKNERRRSPRGSDDGPGLSL